MRRTCARPGCSDGANATLAYNYAARSVTLSALASDGHPMSHGLCDLHADSTSVPRGWHLEDRRNVTDMPVQSDAIAS